MFPLSSTMEFSAGAELALAALLGLGFGFCLERAGFGSARKLTSVFYLYDMAVVKVMFTAIVTTLIGLTVLSAVGALDLKELYLEQTNYTAQIVGGMLFGAGFIVGGYCPGTSIAAMATGRKDGMVFVLGMFTGVFTYAELTPGLDAWYTATAQGRDDAARRHRHRHGLVGRRLRRLPALRRLGHVQARSPLRPNVGVRSNLG